jgi:hypothetical protein
VRGTAFCSERAYRSIPYSFTRSKEGSPDILPVGATHRPPRLDLSQPARSDSSFSQAPIDNFAFLGQPAYPAPSLPFEYAGAPAPTQYHFAPAAPPAQSVFNYPAALHHPTAFAMHPFSAPTTIQAVPPSHYFPSYVREPPANYLQSIRREQQRFQFDSQTFNRSCQVDPRDAR